jgi:hypothetical protein
MAKSLRKLSIALAVLILLTASLAVNITGHPALAAVEKPDMRCQIVPADSQNEGPHQLEPEGADLEQELPIMKPSRETRQKWVERYNRAPKAVINEQIKRRLEQAPTGSLDLLGYLQYTPSERNQGTCGNCWAWAGTGVMEVALNVQNEVKDRLSIQYLNSNYNGGSGADWACCGGWLDDVTDFYTSTGLAIPWSNTNASYGDGSLTCDSGSTSVPAGTISTTPYYPITSINTQTITTQGVSQATAIDNIKNVLNQNKAVWFAFFLPTADDWNNFRDFWYNQPGTAIWNPDFSCGHTWDDLGGGGHAVLCVGYNDDDPDTANHYWLIVNSWGTAGGNRPDGLFRLAMNMNYNCTYYDPPPTTYYSFYWQTLDVTFKTEEPERLVGTDTVCTSSVSTNYARYAKFTAAETGTVNQFRLYARANGHVKVAIYQDNGSGNNPGTRLNFSDDSQAVTANQWNTITFPDTDIEAGTVYWLAVANDVAGAIAYNKSGGNGFRWQGITFGSFNWPATASWSGSSTVYNISLAGWGTPAPPELTVETDAATAVGDETATLNGTLSDLGTDDSATLYFEYSDDGYPGTTVPATPPSATSAPASFSTTLSSLTNGQEYHFRAKAVGNTSGETYGSDMTFTPGLPPERLVGTDTVCTSSVSTNYARYAKFTAAETGTINQFRLYARANGHVKVAIYRDNGSGNNPGTRLNFSDDSQAVTANQWNTITFPDTDIEAGTVYWLAVANDVAGAIAYNKSGGDGFRWQGITFGSFNWPATASWSGSSTVYNISLAGWGTITPPVPPDIPTLLSPGASITFKWSTSTGATTYWLQVNTASNFTGTDMFNAEVGDVTSHEVTGLSLGTTYYWRVKAGNTVGWSDWSSTRSVVSNEVP